LLRSLSETLVLLLVAVLLAVTEVRAPAPLLPGEAASAPASASGTGCLTLASVSTEGASMQSDGVNGAILSADGERVLFESHPEILSSFEPDPALDLVSSIGSDRSCSASPGGYGGTLFIRDLTASCTKVVGVEPYGRPWDVTDDGRFVLHEHFDLPADAGLTPSADNANDSSDVYLYDSETASREAVSVSSSGEVGNDHSHLGGVSADGRFVVFDSRPRTW